jgi:hypothetical protein
MGAPSQPVHLPRPSLRRRALRSTLSVWANGLDMCHLISIWGEHWAWWRYSHAIPNWPPTSCFKQVQIIIVISQRRLSLSPCQSSFCEPPWVTLVFLSLLEVKVAPLGFSIWYWPQPALIELIWVSADRQRYCVV